MDMFGLTRSDRIETLSLARNNLSQISPKAFQHTPNLITLLLQYNQIEELSSHSPSQVRTPFLASLKKLVTLQLSSNNLSVIRSDELPKSLSSLALDHNVISKIEARALEGMEIKRLYLHSNKLNYLYQGTFDSFSPKSVEAVDVSLNPWVCVCNDPKEWLPRWLEASEEADVAEGALGCLAIPNCGQKEGSTVMPEEEEVYRSGWITVAATILTIVTIVIMVIIAMLYFKDARYQFPLRGRRSDSDLHKLIENDPLNIASDSILVVPAMPKRNTGPKKTVRFQNF
ncbi:P-granule-associated novel protein 1 [Caenorhabditis elegans]|nr:P-granule-associated novel protein 1 [Caenorhabditis elegans]CAA84337.2 P-granule-associated novel protein 1 [Caenorhabditis elegans]|eukprot:NP_497924.2 P-granule-associated novel protein 1 [Caenorhabditis elegans]